MVSGQIRTTMFTTPSTLTRTIPKDASRYDIYNPIESPLFIPPFQPDPAIDRFNVMVRISLPVQIPYLSPSSVKVHT